MCALLRVGEMEVELSEAAVEKNEMRMKLFHLIRLQAWCKNMSHDLKAFTLLKALNPLVRFAFANVLNLKLCQECAHRKGKAEHAGAIFTGWLQPTSMKILPRRWLA